MLFEANAMVNDAKTYINKRNRYGYNGDRSFDTRIDVKLSQIISEMIDLNRP